MLCARMTDVAGPSAHVGFERLWGECARGPAVGLIGAACHAELDDGETDAIVGGSAALPGRLSTAAVADGG